MFKFYLRQTVPFKFYDLIKINSLFTDKKYRSVKYTENNIKNRIGTKYAVVTNSLRSGLTNSLKFYVNKYPNRNQIILPEYSFYSNLSSTLELNLKVIYAPIDKNTLELDLNILQKYITKKTLGIIVTHIHGLSYDMQKLNLLIKRNKLVLFEDCAHVFGQHYNNRLLGSFGVGCFSFGPGKNITSFGGGSVCTNDDKLFRYLKNRQIPNNNFISEIKTLLFFVAFTIASDPYFSFFLIKPILGLNNIIKKNSNHKSSVNINDVSEKILTPNRLQLLLLNYQLKKIYGRIENIFLKRKTIANIYTDYFSNNNVKREYNYYFQYPVNVTNSKKTIFKGLNNNIDIQQDYCSYLPDLYKSNKLETKFNKNIVYLPVNYHMSKKHTINMLNKIF